ncbi:MAG: DNA-binding protein [Clostridia bacterium]|nr:DNA-binding protein [Clostridia bacterium]
MKGYLSVREISYKWNVSERWVSKLAQDGRIPGVERFGRSWAIPEDAEKPADPRKEKCMRQK